MTGLPTFAAAASRRVILGAAFLALALQGGAAANEPAQDGPPNLSAKPAPVMERPAPVPQATASEVERFCSNIADAARDRRYALQAAELQSLQAEIDARIKALEEKRAEYETWLKRREDFLAKAEDGVVKIYSGMKPDAAAERLAELDLTLAAGILMKLDARKAGVILNEMDRKAAATLTGVMAAVTQKAGPT